MKELFPPATERLLEMSATCTEFRKAFDSLTTKVDLSFHGHIATIAVDASFMLEGEHVFDSSKIWWNIGRFR